MHIAIKNHLYNIIFLTTLAFIISCNNDTELYQIKEKTAISKNDTIPEVEILEYFIDSLNIGTKKENKIELIWYRIFKDEYVIVKFHKVVNDNLFII